MTSHGLTRREFVGITVQGIAWSQLAGHAGTAAAVADSDMTRRFLAPGDADKPWAYWWWLNGTVTERSITRDLEEMKKKGFGGLLMFDARGYGNRSMPPPPPRFEFMSDEWRRLFKFALREADRLGLKMSTNLSTDGGSLRSPWPAGEDAPKKLVWASAEVLGPRRVTCELRRSNAAHFSDVALIAVRHGDADSPRRPEGRASDDIDLSRDWREIVTEVRAASAPIAEAVDLTARVGSDGRLTWEVPGGRWTLLRFACVTMDGYDYDVDILSAKAAQAHFERMGAKFLEDAGPLAGKTLTYFYNVSWEGASPTWTPGFEKEFLNYRGYDPRPYLPVVAGMTVGTQANSVRFLRDYSRTLGDCFMTNCYQNIGDLCHRAGVRWHSESGGPWTGQRRAAPLFAQADQLAFWGRNDMPQGEFWYPRRTNVRRAAMAAHVYGKPIVAAEAFTGSGPHWSEYPALIKPVGDEAFIDGINHFVWHTFDASPEEFGKPGLVYSAGTHLNPNVTWWEQAGAFLDYLARCQFMLRQGRVVNDVCVYTSDRNNVGWGRCERWSDVASLELPKGYSYDSISTEVLLERLSVENGRLVLPDGMQYRILVVDLEEDVVPAEALRKIAALAEAGATVVLGRRRPIAAPGLKEHALRDEEIGRLASTLWGEPGKDTFRRSLGRGKLIGGTSLREVLEAERLIPDFSGPWEYIHRRSDDMDIYFVVGSGSADCVFRCGAKEPEFWDPITGQTRDVVHYRSVGDGQTAIPISLAVNGSIFVVFRRPAASRHITSISGTPETIEVLGRTENGARLRVWRAGSYLVESSGGAPAGVDAPNLPDATELAGPWQVRFTPGWGAPESVVFDRLIAWNQHQDEGIRFFSGTAVYRKTIELDRAHATRPARLQLGQVRHVARVRANGRDLGVLWTEPWTADLTGILRAGKNELEIEVTNLWVNRLIGDAALPEEKRFTKTIVPRGLRDVTSLDSRGIPRPMGRRVGYVATDLLETSGLLGPVRLEFGEDHEVRL